MRDGTLLPGRRKLAPEAREEIRKKELSQNQLALKYGVSPRLIFFIQHPEKYAASNTGRKEACKAWRALHPPKPRKPRKRKPKPRSVYEKQIHEAIGAGMTANDLDQKLSSTLTRLVQNRLEIEKQINETRKAQNALWEYLDITPVTLDPDFVPRKNEDVIWLTSKDMRWLMTECGLNVKRLYEGLGKQYSIRALQSYRQGQVAVPRNVADFLRGYPRKSHIEIMN